MSIVLPLADQDDRDQIATALDDTLVVEAAAGTGKTTELVRRIVRVIETGRARVTEIVAVTFTEKAAGELKLRLREALEEVRKRASAGSDERARLDKALETLEEAQVSTIHGFCADLLRERPVEAHVDPLFTVLTEAQAGRMFDAAFHAWFQEQLGDPPEGIRRSLRRPSFGGFGAVAERESGPIDRLRHAGYELTQWRDFDGAWQQVPFDREGRIDGLVQQLQAFAQLSSNPAYSNDNLSVDTRPARQLGGDIQRTEAVAPRDYNRLEGALIDLCRNSQFQRARKGSGKAYRPGVAREDVWRAREDLQNTLSLFEADANANLAALLHQELRGCVDRYQQVKDRGGALDFLDLLLRARNLIQHNMDVRRSFQQRFKRIFVDEFQDTDPLQAEILLLLAADDPSTTDWRQVRPVSGKLFIVGDPKQSIYRFRRADVGLYRRVYAMLQGSGAKRVTLRTSFRARPNIQRVINAAFEPAMRLVSRVRNSLTFSGRGIPSGGVAPSSNIPDILGRRALPARRHAPENLSPNFGPGTLAARGEGVPDAAVQAGYVPLEPFRSDPAEQPSVVVLPVPKPYATQRIANTAIEASLPDAVGAFVEWLIHESSWKVAERPTNAGWIFRSADEVDSDAPVVSGFSRTPLASTIARGFMPGEQEHLVPIQARHVCLLFRRFVSYDRDMTRPYVEALEARGISHLLVGGRSFHNRAEIETLRAALAAIEWPDDELSVFATLRGALLAIGDEELLEYRDRFGRFHPFRVPNAPVASGFSQTDPVPNASVVSGFGQTRLLPNASVVSGFSQTDLARLTPIIDGLQLLQSLHRSRNYVPVATTISRLLEATRAHARFALEHGGEQVLANVLHVAELARRYEAEGGISFRGFIDALREQAEGGEAGEAPILEEGSDGVRLMTVHKAKGLEFPVVILADMTAKLRASAASRFIDPDRDVCAVRLAGCSPRDLVDHEAEELQRDEAEGVRVAYVAATRARDLLVVPAVGDGEREGWIEPLNKAIYPTLETRRQNTRAPGCPEFSTKDSVIIRPNGDPAGPDTVSPGLHMFGSNHVVAWWDPRALNLDAEPPLGIRWPELIVKDVAPPIVEAGLAEYNAWRARRDAAISTSSQPTIAVRTVTAWSKEGGATPLLNVEIIELPRAETRPTGPRFGTLVHAVLASVRLNAEADEIHRWASTHGRILDATEQEVDAAAEIARTVLGHPLLQRAAGAANAGSCRREVPIAWRDEGVGLVEGVIDCAFEENGAWTILDFKTEEDLRTSAAAYRRQMALYAAAVQAISQRQVSAVLVHV